MTMTTATNAWPPVELSPRPGDIDDDYDPLEGDEPSIDPAVATLNEVRGELDTTLRRMAYTRRRIREAEEPFDGEIQRLQRRIDALVSRRFEATAAMLRRVEEAEAYAIRLMAAHLRLEEEAGRKVSKTLKLPYGEARATTRDVVSWDSDAKLVSALKAAGLDDLVRTKSEPDKVGIKKDKRLVVDLKTGALVVAGTGEMLPVWVSRDATIKVTVVDVD